MKNCVFHNWSKWIEKSRYDRTRPYLSSNPNKVNETSVTEVIVVQERSCERCGIIEGRSEHVKLEV